MKAHHENCGVVSSHTCPVHALRPIRGWSRRALHVRFDENSKQLDVKDELRITDYQNPQIR